MPVPWLSTSHISSYLILMITPGDKYLHPLLQKETLKLTRDESSVPTALRGSTLRPGLQLLSHVSDGGKAVPRPATFSAPENVLERHIRGPQSPRRTESQTNSGYGISALGLIYGWHCVCTAVRRFFLGAGHSFSFTVVDEKKSQTTQRQSREHSQLQFVGLPLQTRKQPRPTLPSGEVVEKFPVRVFSLSRTRTPVTYALRSARTNPTQRTAETRLRN